MKRMKSVAIQTDRMEKTSTSTNTPNYLDDMLIQGKNMKEEDFQKFIKGKKEITSKLFFWSEDMKISLENGINILISSVNVGRDE